MVENQKLALVTGGAGFIGSHLCERLVKEGYQVISLDNYFTGTPENHVAGVEYRTGHTKDISELVSETPELVFHLGEYARTEKSFEDIEQVWDLNIIGTFSILEFVRNRGCKLIYAGSSTKFADGGEGRNQSPYAWSKSANTELVENYGKWFGLNYVITYFYNVYGPRELTGPFGTLIKIFTELYRQGQHLTVTGPGTQTRNFTHVSDIVDGLILAAKDGQGDGYGIGAEQEFSVMEVARLFGGEIYLMPERAGNRMSGGVNNTKIKALGWRQKHQLTNWIKQVKEEIGSVIKPDQRIMVFTTTFYPYSGPAENALCDLMRALPEIHFDVITTKFSSRETEKNLQLPNVTIHQVGYGRNIDKYLLPLYGSVIATKLRQKNQYLFQWSLFASYGALAALLTRGHKIPHLITLADQKLTSIPYFTRIILGLVLGKADQIYALNTAEAKSALKLSRRTTLINSIGLGDTLANQLRISYMQFLQQRLKLNKQ